MAEGLARATGAPVPFKWRGKDGKEREYVLDRFTIGDWGFLEECLLSRKRRAIVKQAKDLQSVLDDAEYRALLKEKIAEASAVHEVSNEEMADLLSGGKAAAGESTAAEKAGASLDEIRGIVFLMATLLNRRYPDEFTEESVLELLASDSFSKDHMAEFVMSVGQLQGNSGNLTSRTADVGAVATPAA